MLNAGVLGDAGKVSADVAKKLATQQFEKYQHAQRQIEATEPTSDFDNIIAHIKQLEESPKNETE